MDTKEAIKQQACTLFNLRGLSAVTLRDIALVMDRSYGNLTYHYSSKEALVESLYGDMVQALGAISTALTSAQDPLVQILKAPEQTFAISLRYLFLFRDYLDVVRSYPKLAESITVSNSARKQRLRAMLIDLRAQGLLRPELQDADIDYLMELSGAMRTFFFMQFGNGDLQRPGLEAAYVHYVNRLLYPYLSAAGQAVYREVLGSAQ
jgi:AcrR family transcriptional regulator